MPNIENMLYVAIKPNNFDNKLFNIQNLNQQIPHAVFVGTFHFGISNHLRCGYLHLYK